VQTFFSGGDIDRQSWLRSDAEQLDAKLAAPTTRFIATSRSRCLIADNAPVMLQRDDIETLADPNDSIYLGIRSGHDLFAIDLGTDAAGTVTETLRAAVFSASLGELSARDAALLAYAKGMVEWRQRHRHCGCCGTENRAAHGGSTLVCANTDCGHRSFPRIDPAIIVLTREGESCLLGLQVSWPAGRYSTIAGFVEPGESLEDAVRREVHEETNVAVGECRYLGSQPWPFPGSLMIGFHATALNRGIQLNDGELAEAQWFTRDDIAAGVAKLPPGTSIAYRLIEHWFDEWDGPRLATLDVCSSFSSSAPQY
jgi:NAD+ diphosphatase